MKAQISRSPLVRVGATWQRWDRMKALSHVRQTSKAWLCVGGEGKLKLNKYCGCWNCCLNHITNEPSEEISLKRLWLNYVCRHKGAASKRWAPLYFFSLRSMQEARNSDTCEVNIFFFISGSPNEWDKTERRLMSSLSFSWHFFIPFSANFCLLHHHHRSLLLVLQ